MLRIFFLLQTNFVGYSPLLPLLVMITIVAAVSVGTNGACLQSYCMYLQVYCLKSNVLLVFIKQTRYSYVILIKKFSKTQLLVLRNKICVYLRSKFYIKFFNKLASSSRLYEDLHKRLMIF